MQRSIYPRNADEPRGGIGKLAREGPSFTRKKAPFFIKQKRLSLHSRRPRTHPGAPSARRDWKIEAAFFGGEREAPFFRKAKTSLSLHLGNPAPVPAHPPRAGTGKLKRLSLVGSARGPFLSPERKGPLAKKHPTYLYPAATSCASCWARGMLGSSAGTSSLRIGLPTIVRPVSSSNQTAASA